MGPKISDSDGCMYNMALTFKNFCLSTLAMCLRSSSLAPLIAGSCVRADIRACGRSGGHE